MRRILYALILVLTFSFLCEVSFAQATGQYDVRFVLANNPCNNNVLYIDVEVKANGSKTFYMGDQNYKFTYNRTVLSNPRVVQELGFSGSLPIDPTDPTSPNMPYGTHSTSASIDPGSGDIGLGILNIVWTPGRNGVFVTNAGWEPVSRIALDIIDVTSTGCPNLVWRDKSNSTHFTNLTEVQAFPPIGSPQTLPYSTTVNVPEGLYASVSGCLGTICAANFPVEWLSFDATLINGEATLDWATAQEHNNDYFLVERSLDNTYFEAIGTMPSHTSNSEVEQHYRFVDADLSGLTEDFVYYRLRQVDLDGNVSYSDIVQLRLDAQQGLNVYPNPTNGKLYVEFLEQGGSNNLLVEIFDVQGRLLKKEWKYRDNSPLDIEVSTLNSGMYYVQVSNDLGSLSAPFVVR